MTTGRVSPGWVLLAETRELLHVKEDYLRADDIHASALFDKDQFQVGRWALTAQEITIHAADVPPGEFMHHHGWAGNYQFPKTLPEGTWLERYEDNIAVYPPPNLRPDVTVSDVPGDAADTHLVPLGTWNVEPHTTTVAAGAVQFRGVRPNV